MKFNLIVAMCRNNGIGMKGAIPWHIPTDLRYFSKLTRGDGTNAIVMGSNTWTSLDRNGLPGRDNFVLSKSNRFDMLFAGDRLIKSFKSLDEFIFFLELQSIYKEVWIIGGQQVYDTFLAADKVDQCYVTYIDKEFPCDTFFPSLDTTVSQWTEQERTLTHDAFYNCTVEYIVYNRRGKQEDNSVF